MWALCPQPLPTTPLSIATPWTPPIPMPLSPPARRGCRRARTRAPPRRSPLSPPAPAPAALLKRSRSSRACSRLASPRPPSPSHPSSPRPRPPPVAPRSCTRTSSRAGCSTASPTRGPRWWGSLGGAGFHEALKVFGEMPVQSVVTWNCLISSFVQFGHSHDAAFWFRELVRSGDGLSDSVLSACASINGHELGRKFEEDAQKVLEEVPENSITCWNAMISGRSDGDDPTSLAVLRDMLHLGIKPNKVSFSSSLKDPSLSDLRQIHSLVTNLGHGCDDYVSSAIISSYASHGIVSYALAYGVALDPESCNVSVNVFSWGLIKLECTKNPRSYFCMRPEVILFHGV